MKKTESIEVRVSAELKEEFSNVSKEKGLAMSQIIRDLIQSEVLGATNKRTNTKTSVMKKINLYTIAVYLLAFFFVSTIVIFGHTDEAFAKPSASSIMEILDSNQDTFIDENEIKILETLQGVSTESTDFLWYEQEEVNIETKCYVDVNCGAAVEGLSNKSFLTSQWFDNIDKNADGRIDKDEVTASLKNSSQWYSLIY